MRDLVNNGDTWGYDRTTIPEQSQNVADMIRAPCVQHYDGGHYKHMGYEGMWGLGQGANMGPAAGIQVRIRPMFVVWLN